MDNKKVKCVNVWVTTDDRHFNRNVDACAHQDHLDRRMRTEALEKFATLNSFSEPADTAAKLNWHWKGLCALVKQFEGGAAADAAAPAEATIIVPVPGAWYAVKYFRNDSWVPAQKLKTPGWLVFRGEYYDSVVEIGPRLLMPGETP